MCQWNMSGANFQFDLCSLSSSNTYICAVLWVCVCVCVHASFCIFKTDIYTVFRLSVRGFPSCSKRRSANYVSCGLRLWSIMPNSIGNSRRKRGGVLIRILKCKLPTAWPVCESLKIIFAIISIKFKWYYTNPMASYCDTKGWYEESSPLDTKALSWL